MSMRCWIYYTEIKIDHNISIGQMIKKINGFRIFMNKKLGKGAYGTVIPMLLQVYEGEETSSETPCAIKVLEKASINSDPYLKAALVSEIKIMKVLKSPNIVELFDVMESTNNYYIIQELCDIDLEKYLKQQPQKVIPEKEAIKFLTEICNGFLTLVKEGVVHRDLKPANIFISKKEVKIGDFGFAKKNTGGLKNHTAVGTPLYMPIEILKGLPYTSKCDIWALGFIFYEMLHGRTPWTARSQFQLITNIEKKPLIIDESLSELSKDFLKKSLSITEDKRISWDQVFAHPIFNKYFSSEILSNKRLQNKFKKVMADIRFQVNSQNINLKKLWENNGYGENKELNETEFKNFLKCIIPNIETGEEHYFFRKMDINKDGSVSLKELEAQFVEHGIALTSQFENKIPFLLKRLVSIEEDNENSHDHGIDIELENKVRTCFKRLEQTLQKKNLNLYKVFVAYDGDKNGQLSVEEFGKILKRLDSTFHDQEISVIFETIDQDKSKTVEFDQLNYYYSKINGIPESLNLPPDYQSLKKADMSKKG